MSGNISKVSEKATRDHPCCMVDWNVSSGVLVNMTSTNLLSTHSIILVVWTCRFVFQGINASFHWFLHTLIYACGNKIVMREQERPKWDRHGRKFHRGSV